jgi:hypothetical protein
MMGARVRLIGPPTLVPGDADRWGCEVFHDMREGLQGCDVVMMLRLQLERMEGALVPSTREYFRFWGLDREKLAWANAGREGHAPGADEPGRGDRFRRRRRPDRLADPGSGRDGRRRADGGAGLPRQPATEPPDERCRNPERPPAGPGDRL